MRRSLGLRSTWFRIGVLALATPDAPVTFGKRVSLNGIARNLPGVKLERREAGSAWQLVAAGAWAQRRRDGHGQVARRPTTGSRVAPLGAGSRTSPSLRSYASVA